MALKAERWFQLTAAYEVAVAHKITTSSRLIFPNLGLRFALRPGAARSARKWL